MKKLFSISFALLILVSGMNLTIAIHTCGKSVEAVKWSFTGEKASCGMEVNEENCPLGNGYSSNCCQDRMTVYSVDNNYKPSPSQNLNITIKYLRTFYISSSNLFNSFNFDILNHNNVIPTDIAMISAVYLPEICIFRI